MTATGNRTKILLGALVLILITVLWYLFIFSPKRDAIDVAAAEYDSALLRESTLRTQLSTLQEIKDNELSYLFAIGQMEASIPSTPQADAFIEDITFLAESTGVELSSISLVPPIANAETGGFEVPITISIEGEYFEILGFLYGVEALDRLVRVDSIGLNPIPGEDEPETTQPPDGDEDGVVTEPLVRPNLDLLSADITMRIFTRNPAAGSTADGVDVPQGSAEIDDGSGEDI